MTATTIRYTTFPRTDPPEPFVTSLVDVFREHEAEIATVRRDKGLTSDQVLAVLAEDLLSLGFQVELGKAKAQKIERPVFFGENGTPTLRYEIDAYHPEWRCGLEVEAGRAWMGNAIYRDLVQSAVMVGVDQLCLAVSNAYKYQSSGKRTVSKDYDNTVQVADALYSHSRVSLPYKLVVLGY